MKQVSRLFAAGVLFLLLACTPRDDSPLLIAAAASLGAVLPELIDAFEEESGIRAEATTGASGQLAQQIREGAPIDVFLSADREWPDRLAQGGHIEEGTLAVYARGRLVMFQNATSSFRITNVGDVANAAVRRIAIANPETAPYGSAARQALAAAGVLSEVEARIVIAENVRQTVQYVETAGADVAFTSEALMTAAQTSWMRVPQELYEPLDQALGVVANRPASAAARAFAAFLLGPRGRDILRRSGFTPPDDPT